MKKLYMLTSNQVPAVTGTLTECQRMRKQLRRYGKYVTPPTFRIIKIGAYWKKGQ